MWIIVHLSYTGDPCAVNTDQIWRIVRYKGAGTVPGKCMIFRSDIQDDYFVVTETFEEVMALIDKATLLVSQICESSAKA